MPLKSTFASLAPPLWPPHPTFFRDLQSYFLIFLSSLRCTSGLVTDPVRAPPLSPAPCPGQMELDRVLSSAEAYLNHLVRLLQKSLDLLSPWDHKLSRTVQTKLRSWRAQHQNDAPRNHLARPCRSSIRDAVSRQDEKRSFGGNS